MIGIAVVICDYSLIEIPPEYILHSPMGSRGCLLPREVSFASSFVVDVAAREVYAEVGEVNTLALRPLVGALAFVFVPFAREVGAARFHLDDLAGMGERMLVHEVYVGVRVDVVAGLTSLVPNALGVRLAVFFHEPNAVRLVRVSIVRVSRVDPEHRWGRSPTD